jgi:hypothetical protein
MNITFPNFPRCLSILLLQTSKTGNNALDIDAIYNLKLGKHNLIQQSFTTKLNTKFPWPPIVLKERECILLYIFKCKILNIYFTKL